MKYCFNQTFAYFLGPIWKKSNPFWPSKVGMLKKPSHATFLLPPRPSSMTWILLQATDSMGSITGDARTGAPRVRRYHLLPLPGTKRGIRIFLDRLQLLNILDQVYYFPAVLRIRDPGLFWRLDPRSGMGKKSGSGIRIQDEQPGSECLETIFLD